MGLQENWWVDSFSLVSLNLFQVSFLHIFGTSNFYMIIERVESYIVLLTPKGQNFIHWEDYSWVVCASQNVSKNLKIKWGQITLFKIGLSVVQIFVPLGVKSAWGYIPWISFWPMKDSFGPLRIGCKSSTTYA